MLQRVPAAQWSATFRQRHDRAALAADRRAEGVSGLQPVGLRWAVPASIFISLGELAALKFSKKILFLHILRTIETIESTQAVAFALFSAAVLPMMVSPVQLAQIWLD